MDDPWQPAVILRDWAEVKIPSGEKSRSYDVQGFDSIGPFHGRFTDDHVRIREAFPALEFIEKPKGETNG